MSIIRNLIGACCFLLVIPAGAQDFKTFIQDMRKDFSQWNAMHVVMDITVYDSAESEPYYKQQVSIKRDGDNYWYQVEENEMLLNEKYLIMLDRESRQITCSKRSLEAEKELQRNIEFNVDSIFALYPSPEHLGTEDGVEHYRFLEKNGPIAEVHFYVRKEQYDLKKMEYKYRGGQFVSIQFVVFKKNVKFEPNTFSETRYVTEEKRTIRPGRFFHQYQLVDLTKR
jgi:outer membrane lipoprotein-sorting protein